MSEPTELWRLAADGRAVTLRLVRTPNGERLRIERDGTSIAAELDAVALESLTSVGLVIKDRFGHSDQGAA